MTESDLTLTEPPNRPVPVLEPDAPTRRVPRWGCGDIVYGILAMLGLSTAVGVAVALVADRGAVDLDSPGFTVIGAVAVWIGLGGWALLASRRKGYGTLRSDYHYYFEWYDLLIGLAGAIAAFGLQIAIGAVAMNSGIEPDTNTAPIVEAKGSPGWVVVVAIVVGVGAPFVEELFFRGLTYGALERRFDRWVALGGSTAIFGVMHLQPTANLPGLVVLILQITSIGLVLGFLRMMTNRCGASIVTHMIVNTVATVLVLAGVGGV